MAVWEMQQATQRAEQALAKVRVSRQQAAGTTKEKGTSGRSTWRGERIFDELDDPNALWLPPTRWETVREMLIDPDVCASLDATVLPLLGRKLIVQPGAPTALGKDVAAFVENDLKHMSAEWQDIRGAALLGMLAEGVAPFHTVYSFSGDTKRYHLRKLAYRPPSSISIWHEDEHGGPDGLTQVVTNEHGLSEEVHFEMDELLLFVRNQTRAGITGEPITRRMYGPYKLKTVLAKVGGAAVERHGMGIPTVLYKGNNEATHARIQRILMGLRAGAKQFALWTDLESMQDFKIAGVEGQIIDPLGQLEFHRRAIYFATFTQWLPLGSDGTGARALGDSHLDAFLMMLGALSEMEEATYNRYLIPKWVGYNWGDEIPESELPKVIAPRIDSRNVKEWMEALNSAVLAGGSFDERVVKEAAYQLLDLSLPEETSTVLPPQTSGVTEVPQDTEGEPPDESGDLPTTQAAQGEPLKSDLVLQESGVIVNFDLMEGKMDAAVRRLLEKLTRLQEKQARRVSSIVRKAISRGDYAMLETLEIPSTEEAKALRDEMIILALMGVTQVAEEVQVPDARPNELLPSLDLAVDTMANEGARSLADRMRTAAGAAASLALVAGVTGAGGQIEGIITGASAKFLSDLTERLVSGALHLGRRVVTGYLDLTKGDFLYSARMDRNTCKGCWEEDGNSWPAGSSEVVWPPAACLGGMKCRCILIAMNTGEVVWPK